MLTRRLSPGDGVLTCSLDGHARAHLADVQFSYPLKLIVPARRFLPRVQCAYVIGYGGGLVAGDRVRLKVEVEEGTALVLLTQGSTKVFKTRPGRYLTTTPALGASNTTEQQYRLSVGPSALLVLLPAPVTCFSRARYAQRQVVRLANESSSLVLLDWYTSGRMALGKAGPDGEEWEFESYRSENEVWLCGGGGDKGTTTRLAKDVLLLEDEKPPQTSPDDPSAPRHTTTYVPRVAPYSCYATLFLFGPQTASLRRALETSFTALEQHKLPAPYALVWSYSTLPGHPEGGGVARCAAATTEGVKEWVVQVLQLGGIEELVGKDLWKTAFN
ncbi:urease accessory protein UreD [Rhodotorula paludigena]|uniref:urease accessory protein UreD n=1 Tax=Rhodotorula paludigena TaxID=86838 RepID=UPI003176FBDE